MGTLNQRQRRYCAKIVSTLFVKYGTDTQSSLLKFWITRIVSDNILGNILESCNTEFPPEFLPKSLKVTRISKTLSDTFLTRCRSTKEQKKHGILYMISVVKKAGLTVDSHGDIQTLMDATACSRKFARTILII